MKRMGATAWRHARIYTTWVSSSLQGTDPDFAFAGIRPHPLDSRRDRFRNGVQLAGETKRPIPEEADPDVFSLPQSDRNKRRCGAAIQLTTDVETPHVEFRLCGKLLVSSIRMHDPPSV